MQQYTQSSHPLATVTHSGRRTSPSYIEVLCKTPDLEELDTRIRINLQEALIRFIKDERKWSTLPFSEQTRLLQKLATRSNESNPFSEEIIVKCQDERGKLVTRKAKLLLDTTRNKNLSSIFDQIINQHIALVFHEQFCFGLLDHLERLIALETKMILLSGDENTNSSVIPLSYLDVQEDLLPLSTQDFEMIREKGLGIMIELIPKFLRLPLNKLYYAINQINHDFPSLALQFYLDTHFATKPNSSEDAIIRQMLIRTFFTKAFYSIVRVGGLKIEHLSLPEASRSNRFQYFTGSDDDSVSLVNSEDGNTSLRDDFRALVAELQHRQQREQILKQRRNIQGPSIKTELNLEKVLEDIFMVYCDQWTKEIRDETEYLQRTLWLPLKFERLNEWDKQLLQQHLYRYTDEQYLALLTPQEQDLIQRWEAFARQEYANERTRAQVEAIGDIDEETFVLEVMLRFVSKHQWILEQHQELITEQVAKQVTRMFRVGSITADMIIRDRYQSFQEDVLPYIYFCSVPTSRDEPVWLESPYPLSKLLYLIDRVETMTGPEGTPLAEPATLSMAKALLVELFHVERERLLQPETSSELVPSQEPA
ncbi:MAG: hypothetical protein HC921_15905 [Synechococcaceae cyanobacterium SM2_3_1]|nr:hypothetical protein [Synechococcaceae cyanobacterium SM2_3_1]